MKHWSKAKFTGLRERLSSIGEKYQELAELQREEILKKVENLKNVGEQLDRVKEFRGGKMKEKMKARLL